MSKPGRRLAVALLLAGAASSFLPQGAVADSCAGAMPSITLCLLNAERAGAGLPPLRLDDRLARAARAHARSVVQRFAGSRVVPEPNDRGIGGAIVIRAGNLPSERSAGGRLDVRRDPDVAARYSNEAASPNCQLTPSTESAAAMSEATLCLLNGERADHGLGPLTPNDKLAAAATAYAQDLVAGSYFSHTGRDGSGVLDRIQRSGYLPRDAGWVLGENLAWGTGSLATPGSIMQAWMNSPGHRENILNPDYREIGIGIVAGNPAAPDGLGATYATEFGAIEGVDTDGRAALLRRVARTGWLRRRTRWILGETVAWGRGALAEPAIVAAWMRSARHRRVVLRPGFRRVGIATAAGVERRRDVLIADFGAVRRRDAATTRRPRRADQGLSGTSRR